MLYDRLNVNTTKTAPVLTANHSCLDGHVEIFQIRSTSLDCNLVGPAVPSPHHWRENHSETGRTSSRKFFQICVSQRAKLRPLFVFAPQEVTAEFSANEIFLLPKQGRKKKLFGSSQKIILIFKFI